MLVHTASPSEDTSAKSIFDKAVSDFQDEVDDQELFDIDAIQTADDLYKEIEKTQEEQGRNRQLRNMKQMAPLIECLEHYSSVLDTFVQVKPAVLALIWVCRPIPPFYYTHV